MLKIGTSRVPLESALYLCWSILVLAAAGIGVPQSTIAVPLDIPAALALLHRVGDGTLGVPARLDFYASLRLSSESQPPTINKYARYLALQSRFGETNLLHQPRIIYSE